MFTAPLLFVAVTGLLSCTVFLALVVAACLRFRRPAPKLVPAAYPPVTLLKPLCGMEPQLEKNLESFFRQDYPAFEIIFGARDANDPALDVVRRLAKRYPEITTKIVLSGEPSRANAKVCSLLKMYAAASFEYLVISDSDVHVQADYLQAVIRPLLDPDVGMVTCLYRGVPTGGIWSRLEALGMSVEMTAGVVVADMLEGMRFALGPTMAIRRDVLKSVGGLPPLLDYCADDYILGQRVYQSGRIVVLSKHIIDHVVVSRSFLPSMLHQVRWMKSTRFSRQKGHIGQGLTFAVPFGLLAFATLSVAGYPWSGAALLGWSLLNRMLLAVFAGWWVVDDVRSLRYCWLYPVRDLIGFFTWCASFFGSVVVWRAGRYRLHSGGRMSRVGLAAELKEPSAVAVDNLA
jgi:ceramide glucosyltransferase